MADIGKRIKLRRESLFMTQEELANKLGYKNKSTIAKIENGTNDIIQSKVCEFAQALDTTIAYLMGWEDNLTAENTELTVKLLEDSEMLEYVSKLMALNEKSKKAIYHIIDALNDKEGHLNAPPTDH